MFKNIDSIIWQIASVIIWQKASATIWQNAGNIMISYCVVLYYDLVRPNLVWKGCICHVLFLHHMVW